METETIKPQKPNTASKKKTEKPEKDKRIWSMKGDFYKTNLLSHIKLKERECLDIYSLLFQKKKTGQKKPLTFKRKFFHQKHKKLFSDQVSEKCEQILSTVYSKINHMKTDSKHLQKMNSLSYQKTSNKLFRPPTTSSSKVTVNSSNSNFNNNNKYSTTISTNFNTTSSNRFQSSTSRTNKKGKIIFRRGATIENNYNKNSDKFKKLGQIDLPTLYNSIQNKNLNFTRLNDNYRKEMNRIFILYNPLNYLKKLNVLQKENMIIRQDMENIKEKINLKISDRCTGKYFKKEYEKIKTAENNQVTSGRRLSTLPVKIPFNIKFIGDNKSQSVKIFPNGYKIRALYEYSANNNKNKKHNNRNLKISDNNNYAISKMFERDYESVDDTLEKLFGTLENKPINNIMDNIIETKLTGDEDKKNREKKFFPSFNEIENYLNKRENKAITLYGEKPEIIDKYIKKTEEDLMEFIDNDKKK